MQSRAYNACFSCFLHPPCCTAGGKGAPSVFGAWHSTSPLAARRLPQRPACSCTSEAGAAEQAALRRRRRSCIPPRPPEKARRAAASKQSVFPAQARGFSSGYFSARQAAANPRWASRSYCLPAFSRRPAPSPHIRRARAAAFSSTEAKSSCGPYKSAKRFAACGTVKPRSSRMEQMRSNPMEKPTAGTFCPRNLPTISS